MKSYKEYFNNKKITMLGLGLLGRGLNDAKFLAECGADLTITDIKSAEDLKLTLDKLKEYSNIKYVLGEHRLEDFKNCDLVFKAAGVPLDSPYIIEAKNNNIPIEMDESLFCKLMPEGVKVIGVTGTRGKTTVTYLIYEILKLAEKELKIKVYLGGNIKGLATLPLLREIKSGDIVVMELSSWQLQGFGEAQISPNISVFTNLLNDHLNYYLKGSKDEGEAMQKYFGDKANIFKYQTEKDFIICGEKIAEKISDTKSVKYVTSKNDIPSDWKIKIPGEHNLENIACAIKVAEVLDVTSEKIRKGVEDFNGVEGRLQLIKEYKGIKIYNDTTSTTPDATIVALKSLHRGGASMKNIVLIMGGADKNLDMSELVKEIPNYCKKVILLRGTGSSKIEIGDAIKCDDLNEAVIKGLKECVVGDILLFSPAFASFGMFLNEFDRGDKLNEIISGLK